MHLIVYIKNEQLYNFKNAVICIIDLSLIGMQPRPLDKFLRIKI